MIPTALDSLFRTAIGHYSGRAPLEVCQDILLREQTLFSLTLVSLEVSFQQVFAWHVKVQPSSFFFSFMLKKFTFLQLSNLSSKAFPVSIRLPTSLPLNGAHIVSINDKM